MSETHSKFIDKFLMVPVLLFLGFVVAIVAVYLLTAFCISSLYVYYRKKRAQKVALLLNPPPAK